MNTMREQGINTKLNMYRIMSKTNKTHTPTTESVGQGGSPQERKKGKSGVTKIPKEIQRSLYKGLSSMGVVMNSRIKYHYKQGCWLQACCLAIVYLITSNYSYIINNATLYNRLETASYLSFLHENSIRDINRILK